MSEAVPLFPLCFFMAWTGTTLSFISYRSSIGIVVKIFIRCPILNLFLLVSFLSPRNVKFTPALHER